MRCARIASLATASGDVRPLDMDMREAVEMMIMLDDAVKYINVATQTVGV